MVHILNGDALAATFRTSGIHGEVIVCRECFVDGPVSADNTDDFWTERAQFIQQDVDGDADEYFKNVKTEFDKISELNSDNDIFLWFEHDLFCQANMWFIISLLNRSGLTRVIGYRHCPS